MRSVSIYNTHYFPSLHILLTDSLPNAIAVSIIPVGRIVIELRADVVPLSAENFRCLCTGEKGYSTVRPDVRLSYEGTHFTYVHSLFACRGGDVTHSPGGNDGESIYGPRFAHENYTLLNTIGAVGMVHCNRPDSNHSQFYVCSSDSSHLDGSNVVVGYVLRGFGAVQEMEKYRGKWAVDKFAPTEKIYVARCGQLPQSVDAWNYADADYTADALPPFPLDWEVEREEDEVIPVSIWWLLSLSLWFGDGHICAVSMQMHKMRWALETIAEAAKMQLLMQDYLQANRRYKKVERYHRYLCSLLPGDPGRAKREELDALLNQTLNNRSLCELKLCHWQQCIKLCERVLRVRPNLAQAHFRRGKSHLYLRNYDESVADLNAAERLAPHSDEVKEILAFARAQWQAYMAAQKANLSGLFK